MNILNSCIIDNKINIKIDVRIYTLQTVMKTAYNFINEFYIFLDYIDNQFINVQMKLKDNSKKIGFECIIGDFYNELLNQQIRMDIFLKTRNLRQLIVGRALYTECIELSNEDSDEIVLDGSTMTYSKDIFNIASPWNDKFKFEGDK